MKCREMFIDIMLGKRFIEHGGVTHPPLTWRSLLREAIAFPPHEDMMLYITPRWLAFQLDVFHRK